jgi:hypothetical protein
VKHDSVTRFFLCINNEGNPASLEVGKVYRAMPDRQAKVLRLLRVIDESGEDYLYPADQFVAVRLPQAARKVLLGR